jgi:hypothetical protein
MQTTLERTCKSTENCCNNEIGMAFGKEEACDTMVGLGAVNLGFVRGSVGAFSGDFEGAFVACDGVVGVRTGSLFFLVFFLLLFARSFFVCGFSGLDTSDVLGDLGLVVYIKFTQVNDG